MRDELDKPDFFLQMEAFELEIQYREQGSMLDVLTDGPAWRSDHHLRFPTRDFETAIGRAGLGFGSADAIVLEPHGFESGTGSGSEPESEPEPEPELEPERMRATAPEHVRSTADD